MSLLPIVAETASFEAAQQLLEDAELSDGLPMVPPTAGRMEAMLAGIAEPDAVLGLMPPLFGELTLRTIGWNAIVAGCRPAELGVIKAALQATLEPEFNLLGLATTTGSAAVATIVHGPVVPALALNASINCLGPGNRANATIGRAVSLCLRNIGGAVAGSGDMATCGQPGKYTFCFAEGEESPFPPLPLRRGLPSGHSAVTVLGVSGTAEVLPLRDGEGGDGGVEGILEALAIAMQAAVMTTGAARQPDPPQQVFILPLELAQRIAAAGFDLTGLQEHLLALGKAAGCPIAAAPSDIHPIVAGGPGIKMAYLPLWGGGTRMVTRLI